MSSYNYNQDTDPSSVIIGSGDSEMNDKETLDKRIGLNKTRLELASIYLTITLVLSATFTLMQQIAVYVYPALATEKSGMWIPIHGLLVVALAVMGGIDRSKKRTKTLVFLQSARMALVAMFFAVDVAFMIYASIRINSCETVCQGDRVNYAVAFAALPGHVLTELIMLILVICINTLCSEWEVNCIKSKLAGQSNGSVDITNFQAQLKKSTDARLSVGHILEDKNEKIAKVLQSKIVQDSNVVSFGTKFEQPSKLMNRRR